MLLYNPIKSILQVNELFDRFQDKDEKLENISDKDENGISAMLGLSNPFILPKIAFVVVQLLSLALGIWKCGSMGLLPTATSDWLGFMEPKARVEFSFGL